MLISNATSFAKAFTKPICTQQYEALLASFPFKNCKNSRFFSKKNYKYCFLSRTPDDPLISQNLASLALL